MAGTIGDSEYSDEAVYSVSEQLLAGGQGEGSSDPDVADVPGLEDGRKPGKKRFTFKLLGDKKKQGSEDGTAELQEKQAALSIADEMDPEDISGHIVEEAETGTDDLSSFADEQVDNEELSSLPEPSGPEDAQDHAIGVVEGITYDPLICDSLQTVEGEPVSTEEKEEVPAKKKKFSLGLGKKGSKTSKVRKDKKGKKGKKRSGSELGTSEDGGSPDTKPAKKKKKLSLGLGKKKKNSTEITDHDEPYSTSEQEQQSSKRSPSSVIKKIEQIITPKPEVIEEMDFHVGELCVPAPGVPQKDVNITYEVTPGCQYVHIGFEGDALKYHCLEPPLSDSEKEALYIIQNAFDKMAHSEILLVEEEDRAEALRDRFDLIVDIYRLKLSESQKGKFFYYLHKKYMGFDRMDLLMKDPYIEDITCNGPYTPLYVNHRVYGSVATDVVYEEIELNNFVMRMAQAAGRHISVLQPIRDATLTDGSRANLTLGKEVTKRGSTFTIRRFKSNPVSCIDLMNYGTYDARVLAYFWLMIEYKRSVLAAGGTASGKTTTLNALGSFIPPEYKIVSIEDTAEMNLMHPNWTQSITRAGFGGDSSGKSAGDIELFDLLKAALRQRPEYIVVGEVRGAEAGTLFQAISVGHPCMGTIHAGSIHELLSRVESEPMNVPRNLFASVDMVIFNAMVKVGEHFIRRALRIVEIVELDPERKDLITNPVFKWDPVEDKYEFSGSSSLFEDIEEEFGIRTEELVREMDVRARYIESLAAQGICDYKDVARAIRKYARHKDELMETTH